MATPEIRALRDRLTATVLGSETAADLVVVALLARGHVLIEGPPGVGKTSLAHTLAQSIGGTFKRVQFTPDLLPADLLGYSLYRMDRGDFEFVPGPVFANCLLADEINRTSPRVQSALLECMNEGRVTLDGVTRPLPEPFLVVATQNETDRHGTFPLPEPQLDRFLLSIRMTLPTAEVQSRILRGHAAGEIDGMGDGRVLLDAGEILRLRSRVRELPLSAAVADYITALCEALRRLAGSDHAVSVRASLAVMEAARAAAFLDEAAAIHPDHVQRVFMPVLSHRLIPVDGSDPGSMIEDVLARTEVP
jgi:MoxR-like ATPase